MSTPAQKANLARIRDNQRRSRARKREYLQDLENRLRVCELQGIEASAEVQMAARRVAEENRQLRELLQKQGLSDDYINHYLQSAMLSAPDLASPTSFGSNPGPPVQSLQQLLTPRRPNSLDPNVPFPLPTQASRETSATSVSTTTSSLWEGNQPAMSSQYTHHQAMNVPGAMAAPTSGQSYSASVYSSDSASQVEPYSAHQQNSVLGSQRQPPLNSQQIQSGMQGGMAMGYAEPTSSYNPNGRDFGPPSVF
ncbi:unnamed protein product [Clonostachys rhizophaga]|uniref:BZIP domain-containing protein n=1 Tax=Clonostachys rhizophaga TaxID=160324 RepID=A0A9N9UY78_9HYPO|nr:unnamed protein product [Clonostachys rhizophaga]